MGGGGSSTVKTEIPSWVKPYAQDYLRASQSVAMQPYQAYAGQRVSQMNPYQVSGYNAQAQRALQGSAVNAGANRQVIDTLGDKYMGANPYLSGAIDRASQDVNRNYDMVAARSGSFGNSGVEASRQGALADSANAIRYQDYGAERGRQMQALGMAPGIANQDYVDADRLTGAGAAFQAQDQRYLDDDYARFAEARNYPREQLDILGKGLGMNYGSTQSQGGRGNPWNTAIGTAALFGGK